MNNRTFVLGCDKMHYNEPVEYLRTYKVEVEE